MLIQYIIYIIFNLIIKRNYIILIIFYKYNNKNINHKFRFNFCNLVNFYNAYPIYYLYCF